MKKRNDFEREGREGSRAGNDRTGRRSRGEKPSGERRRESSDRDYGDRGDRPPRFEGRAGNDQDRPSGGFRSERPKGFNDRRGREDSERPAQRRPYGDSERRFGDNDRKPRGDRDGQRDFDRDRKDSRFSRERNFGERKEREGNDRPAPRRSFGDNDWKPRGDRDGQRNFDRDQKDSRFSRERNFEERKERDGDERSAPRRSFGDSDRKPRGDRDGQRNFDRDQKDSRFSRERSFGERKGRDGDERPTQRRDYGNSERPFRDNSRGERDRDGKEAGFTRERNFGERKGTERDERSFDKKPFNDRSRDSGFRSDRGERSEFSGRPERRSSSDRSDRYSDSRGKRDGEGSRTGSYGRDFEGNTRPRYEDRGASRGKKKDENESEKDGQIRLNRYIANAGICSRREADELIESGQITVNGKVVNEMGFKVQPSDIVKYGKRTLNPEKLVYILLNKPKDFLTTTDDPEDRKTVLDLIEGACEERVYPVGRLDRNTTGLLLITNDGELADKLTHPSHNTKKIYQAELDKAIALEDFEKLKEGVELEDGFIKPDDIGIVTPDAFVVGIEIHSGKNRIVRRMFEHLGYEVKKLDRTTFAGLNKKDLPRGKWRFLTPKEVVSLKFLS